MENPEKFQVAPGFVLLIEKHDDGYYLKWGHVSDIGLKKYWPQFGDKLPMPVANKNDALLFIFMLVSMFGPMGMKDISKDYPAMEWVIEFI